MKILCWRCKKRLRVDRSGLCKQCREDYALEYSRLYYSKRSNMSDMENLFGEMLKHIGVGKKIKPEVMIVEMLKKMELESLYRLRDMVIRQIEKTERINNTDIDEFDPFKILGVDYNATEEEVTKAYREKAAKAHPDKGGSTYEMSKLNAAYDTLRKVKGW